MPSDTITLEFDGAVAIMSNNRPDKHNAANDEMDARLWEILAELHARPGLRAIVWRGNGASFSRRWRTTNTGQRACRKTYSATLPNSKVLSPPLPCESMTIRSQCRSW